MTGFLTAAKGGASKWREDDMKERKVRGNEWGGKEFKLIWIHCVWDLISGATRSLDAACDSPLNDMI